MKRYSWEKVFFGFSVIFLLAAAATTAKIQAARRNDALNCSSKAIMHFEDTVTESLNVNVHFSFNGAGKGSIVVEGYSNSASGLLYLQRYIQFSYASRRNTPGERHYQISRWAASKSTIDESPDLIFDYFMREMSDSRDGLLLTMEKVNADTVLLSSINSPLFLCSLKPGSPPN